MNDLPTLAGGTALVGLCRYCIEKGGAAGLALLFLKVLLPGVAPAGVWNLDSRRVSPPSIGWFMCLSCTHGVIYAELPGRLESGTW